MKFGMLEIDERCTTVCSMTRYKIKVTNPKFEIRPFLIANSSAIYNWS